MSEGSAKPRAVGPAVICQSGEQARLKGNPGPLWPGNQNLNLSSHNQSENKKPALLPFWRTTFLIRREEKNRQNQEPHHQ